MSWSLKQISTSGCVYRTWSCRKIQYFPETCGQREKLSDPKCYSLPYFFLPLDFFYEYTSSCKQPVTFSDLIPSIRDWVLSCWLVKSVDIGAPEFSWLQMGRLFIFQQEKWPPAYSQGIKVETSGQLSGWTRAQTWVTLWIHLFSSNPMELMRFCRLNCPKDCCTKLMVWRSRKPELIVFNKFAEIILFFLHCHYILLFVEL